MAFAGSATWKHPLDASSLPAWVAAYGEDEYRFWSAFEVAGVSQRLRWVPQGQFLMGSPDDEPGRFDEWEQLPHAVAIDQGFWMFDTPCTQALWLAVMGDNPSHFQEKEKPEKFARHPVENVSWEDCLEFVTRLNIRLEGMQLSLPSEAQWEYACRAGTETPRYLAELGSIAWYDENSKRTTHAVAEKSPNAWGLYDMLGNVWEWCEDGWYQVEMAVVEASALRVTRGGSWYSTARHVRAADRSRHTPSDRYSLLGFRCAEFREGRELGVASRGRQGDGARSDQTATTRRAEPSELNK